MSRARCGHTYTAQEIDLIAAILRQAVDDVRSTSTWISGHDSSGAIATLKQDAREFLLSRVRLAFFAGLCGVEIDVLQSRLLRAAGIVDVLP